MAAKKKPVQHGGGVNISGDNITVSGDIVGRDKTTIRYETNHQDWSELAHRFMQIRYKIDGRPEDTRVDKVELRDTINRIEQEVKKGESANPTKVERWLRFLAEMADDIFQVTVATLASPIAGVAKAIQLIAQKAKEK